MAGSAHAALGASGGFQHQALLYSDESGFVDGTLSFIREGIAAREPIQVAVAASKIDLLRRRLADQGRLVHWTDMAGIGGNPARIIPMWCQFLERYGGQGPARGIGEPIWPERTAAELEESQHHEALLNLAFATGADLTLLCPYDVRALAPAVIDEARRSHPVLVSRGGHRPSSDYRGLEAAAATVTRPLPQPPPAVPEMVLDDLAPVVLRSFVSELASQVNLSQGQRDDLLIAVMAVARGLSDPRGRLRIWRVDDALVCEIRSAKRIYDPLAGREWPPSDKESHRGVWVANQLCSLVQLRRFDSGTVVRLHMAA
ncbi:MAG: sensor histidine kinase [Candidatus Dormibacteraeota bacterium]|nr:sensor histidine kinase [Candidatus Dormibacteraeota bacterium]MDQ6899306.1 sensor histidine kinase [Candidatus Dormibacteraeota bacterium]